MLRTATRIADQNCWRVRQAIRHGEGGCVTMMQRGYKETEKGESKWEKREKEMGKKGIIL